MSLRTDALKKRIRSRLAENKRKQAPREGGYDGGSGMMLEIDKDEWYYRDLQGRYYQAASKQGHFFFPALDRSDDEWYILEGHPDVLAAKKRSAEYHRERRPKFAPQPEKRILP